MSAIATIKTTCPRDCYDACGILVHVEDGEIRKVVGDPDHAISRGKLCEKCAIAYNGVWRDPKTRLTQPLKRVGSKGEGRFAPVSWDQALTEIAAALRPLIEEGRAASILHTHYTGTVGLLGGWFPNRFFHRLGATEIDPDTVCNKAGHAALEMTFGTSLTGFDPRTIAATRTLVIWGANPSHAAPHQQRHWIAAAQRAGTKIIVVDPIGHETAAAADLHLKLRPGTDAALAFAMLHVLRAKHLTDEPFLRTHVLGADELLPGIDEMTPTVAEDLTGVPAADIEAAAVAYGAGPALLWMGQGVQRQPRGGNVFRALSALIAFSGNLGKPGAGFLYMNGPGDRGIDMAVVTKPSLARGPVPTISHMDFAQTLEDPARAKALFNWNNNPAASSPQQGRLRSALAREDLFHVAVELFETDTTAYADIVLPAASFLECDDLVLSYFDLTLSAQVKTREPFGTALPNSEIFRRLARAMDFDDPALFESDALLLEQLLAQTQFDGSFADLAKRGTVTLFEPRVQFDDRVFSTPSGKIELIDTQGAEPEVARIPTAHADPRVAPGHLRILSPASRWLMNSSYGNDPVIRRKLDSPTIILHPGEPLATGLREGDEVTVSNDIGSLQVKVSFSKATQFGTGIIYKGRWPGGAADGANVNVLVSNRKSDLAESTTVHSTEVRLTHRA